MQPPWLTRGAIMSDDRAILATLDGIAAAFNAHDIDAIMGFFADDAEQPDEIVMTKSVDDE